ncbi:MAG: hypothetical protein J5483_06690 [Lachnospiraceae bacterium]|nr:hypothetical protein [Lachnospiraceae bacterium]
MSEQEFIENEEQKECGCEEHEHHHHDHDHEHEHHHHHHHDHDHEHEHHHHHHDDDECDCHEHEHHHHHHHHDGDECDCDDHDHEHEGTTYDVPGYSVLETHSHEGATICSFEKDILTDVERAKEAMEDSINELTAWLDSIGALIGHVKGYIKEAGPTTTFSTTGGTLNIEGHEPVGASIGFASIVFGPTEEELKDKVVEVFERL